MKYHQGSIAIAIHNRRPKRIFKSTGNKEANTETKTSRTKKSADTIPHIQTRSLMPKFQEVDQSSAVRCGKERTQTYTSTAHV